MKKKATAKRKRPAPRKPRKAPKFTPPKLSPFLCGLFLGYMLRNHLVPVLPPFFRDATLRQSKEVKKVKMPTKTLWPRPKVKK